MRPGRLDRLLYVGPPDAVGREEILRIRMKSMSVADDINVAAISALVSIPDTDECAQRSQCHS
jgi:AAA family ATPase